MTDTTNTTEPTNTVEDTPNDESTTTVETPETEEATSPNREAAKYRVRMKEAEQARDEITTERDQLTEQVTNLRRTIAESMTGLHKPAALWAAGTDVNTLLDDNGNVDKAKVLAAVDAAANTLGLSRNPRPDPSAGSNGEASTATEQFASAFAPNRN